MSFTVTCPMCSASGIVGDEQAGRTAKCSSCGAAFICTPPVPYSCHHCQTPSPPLAVRRTNALGQLLMVGGMLCLFGMCIFPLSIVPALVLLLLGAMSRGDALLCPQCRKWVWV